jgi:hypothetical protein
MKRWLRWIDFNKGTEFWSSLVDSMFDVLSKVGRWFRNLESKDGQEPESPIDQKKPKASDGHRPPLHLK